ncbi:tRNA lysidine(34) synthetase TilS [Sulfurospirillum sp. 1612]|uniref:tRNA lysidine(34) synthetase TilS n=1 Tax=Sulfurospirillum sp. 1612 TaxID=3094835 RepID=UPI002F92E505
MQPLPSLHETTVSVLKQGKNLLAFSGGVDSSALFFILKYHDIPFDLAMVDYNMRAQSKQEVAYAKTLCAHHDKTLFLHTCQLEASNFEDHARAERYGFFEKIIEQHHYDHLITAHHLNDKVEWLLMQLGKGSGVVEMLGFDEIETRDTFDIIRPLSHISKQTLLDFLQAQELQYFQDESNDCDDYTRNKIRHKYATALVQEFEKGLVKSFEYLRNDAQLLMPRQYQNIKDLYVCKRDAHDLKNIRQIDHILKKLGILMSSAQRKEVIRTKECVVSHKIAVVFDDALIYIAPFQTHTMPKDFKELCRIHKIPPKIRAYVYSSEIDITALVALSYKLLS